MLFSFFPYLATYRSETAILYNDRAVLENYHVSKAFKIILDDDANILANLSKDEYREFRNLVIEMVLATDMSCHFQQIKTMRSLLNHADLNVDKSAAMSLILHCCDISHPAKLFDIHQRWTYLLMEEFFRQGDMETALGLPYSPLCDRNTTHIAESQIGFIDFIVAPSLDVCGELLDKVYFHTFGGTEFSRSSECLNLHDDDAHDEDDHDDDHDRALLHASPSRVSTTKTGHRSSSKSKDLKGRPKSLTAIPDSSSQQQSSCSKTSETQSKPCNESKSSSDHGSSLTASDKSSSQRRYLCHHLIYHLLSLLSFCSCLSSHFLDAKFDRLIFSFHSLRFVSFEFLDVLSLMPLINVVKEGQGI